MTSRRLAQAGFTLVEVLTVLVIVGLVSSVVVLTLPQKTPAIDVFAKQIQRDIYRMSQESLLTGKPSALGLSEGGYAVMVFENGIWQTVYDVPAPEAVDIGFEKEAANIKLSKNIVPLAVFEPTGQASLFALTLSGRETSYRIESPGDGTTALETGL